MPIEIPNIFKQATTQQVTGQLLDPADIEKIEHPEGDGLLVYWKNLKYPRRGLPAKNLVAAISVPKALIMGILKLVGTTPLKYLVPLAYCLPRKRKIVFVALQQFVRVGGWSLAPWRVEAEGYTRSVQELYTKALTVIEEQFVGEMADVLKEVARIMAMIFDYDNAYRYRVQDAFMMMDKEAFLKNPRKELKRVLLLCATHEQVGDGSIDPAKWRAAARLLPLLLWDGAIKRFVVAYMERLDVEKLWFDAIDWYHGLNAAGYNFGGIHFNIRMALRRRIDRGEDVSPIPQTTGIAEWA